jgi:hypothetical protein
MHLLSTVPSMWIDGCYVKLGATYDAESPHDLITSINFQYINQIFLGLRK